MFEVHESALDMVDFERAADAALLPAGTEHEMLDDQLAAAVEQVGERLLALRTIEHIGLFDLDPWQVAPLRAQLVAQTGEFLFLGQMRLARGQPLLSRDNPMVHHRSISFTSGGGFLETSVSEFVGTASPLPPRHPGEKPGSIDPWHEPLISVRQF